MEELIRIEAGDGNRVFLGGDIICLRQSFKSLVFLVQLRWIKKYQDYFY